MPADPEDIDQFALLLLEEAKRFLEKAGTTESKDGEIAYLHAALTLAFSALEAHVSIVADEISKWPDLAVHTQAILLEREVSLKNGIFEIGKSTKFSRLEDRLQHIHQLGKKPNANGEWLAAFKDAVKLRNRLLHPKDVPTITIDATKRAVAAVIETLDALYRAVYGKRFPYAAMGLDSRLKF